MTSTKLAKILTKGEVTLRKTGPEWECYVTIDKETGLFTAMGFSIVIDKAYKFCKKHFRLQ